MVIYFLGVWIVCETNEVTSKILQDFKVIVDIFRSKGICLSFQIMVHTDAPQKIRWTIEHETCVVFIVNLSIDDIFKEPEAISSLKSVVYYTILCNGECHIIKIWIQCTIPEMWIGDGCRECHFSSITCLGAWIIAVGTLYRTGDCCRCRNKCLYCYGCRCWGHCWCDMESVITVIRIWNNRWWNEFHFTKCGIEVEVSVTRCKDVSLIILHCYLYIVSSGVHMVRYIHKERIVTTPVFFNQCVVYINRSWLIGMLEPKIGRLCFFYLHICCKGECALCIICWMTINCIYRIRQFHLIVIICPSPEEPCCFISSVLYKIYWEIICFLILVINWRYCIWRFKV